MANHTPEQNQKFKTFEIQYEVAIDEAVGPGGRLTQNTAIKMKDAFIEYNRSIGLGGGTLDKISLLMDKEINLSLVE